MSTAGPAHRVVSAVVEYGYPQGHLGHLSAEEEAAFTNFKVLCAEKGCYKPAAEGQVESHDDATLLRFLRARRFIVADAFKQFQETEDWRKANELDKLYETIDLEHYEETRRLYPQWTGRRDRRGIPVYVFEVKHLNSKTMSAYEKSAVKTKTQAKTDGKTSAKLLRLFALYENLVRFTMPLCTALSDREWAKTPITQSNNIVDISGVGLKQFWNLRAHMQDASTLATAHYPETLDRIFIIGAPSFFPTVWGWIKKWFDPITTSKIFILSHHDMKKTLESFIDPANIPKKYGGQLDFAFGDMPVLDKKVLGDKVTWEGGHTDFPHGPMYWINKKGEKIEGMEVEEEEIIQAIAVGTENGVQRKKEVCTLRRKLPSTFEKVPTSASNHLTNGNPTTASQKAGNFLATSTVPEPTITGTNIATAAATSSDTAEPGTNSNVSVTSPPSDGSPSEPPSDTTSEVEQLDQNLEVSNGELVPASRPELNTFVTANEGLTNLSLHEKETSAPSAESLRENIPNGAPVHTTATANRLDPALNPGPTEVPVVQASVNSDANGGLVEKEKLSV